MTPPSLAGCLQRKFLIRNVTSYFILNLGGTTIDLKNRRNPIKEHITHKHIPGEVWHKIKEQIKTKERTRDSNNGYGPC